MSEPIPALPCYLNGEFSTVRDAKVSVLDRGFIFGDGVYEVVPAYAGRPFRFDEHMARLDRSLGEMRIRNPLDRAGWRKLVDQLIAAYAQHVGKKPRGHQPAGLPAGHARRGDARPRDAAGHRAHRVRAWSTACTSTRAEERAKGVACVTADDFRWKKAHIKSPAWPAPCCRGR